MYGPDGMMYGFDRTMYGFGGVKYGFCHAFLVIHKLSTGACPIRRQRFLSKSTGPKYGVFVRRGRQAAEQPFLSRIDGVKYGVFVKSSAVASNARRFRRNVSASAASSRFCVPRG